MMDNDSLNNLLGAANLQPRQNVGNASTDSLTFGQLIERWEQEDPILIPEEYVDVDNLSKYIDIWFKGGLSRALNLDNGYSIDEAITMAINIIREVEI